MQEEVARAFGDKWYIPRHEDIVPLDAEFVKIFLKGVIMNNFNFDLESAQCELESVDNLLGIYQTL